MATNNIVNAPFPLSPSQGGLGLINPTAHGVLVSQGASAVTPKVLTNGQVLIGSTGADPVASALSAGVGISITNGAGTISISSTAVGLTWSTVAGTTQAITAGNAYVVGNAGLTTFTLPATAAVGDTFIIAGLGAGGWTIAQNASQLIRLGNIATTVTTGTLASSDQYDLVQIACIVTNTTWMIISAVGNPTYT